MISKQSLFRIAVFLLSVVILAGGAMTLSGSENKTYEIHPEIAVGPYQNETMHIMSAYERLMDRYMSLVEGNLQDMARGSQETVRKLESIEKKLDAMSMRIGRIEKALNISPTTTSRTRTARPRATRPPAPIEKSDK